MIGDEEVLRVLRAFNPWWTTGVVPDHLVPSFRRTPFYSAYRRLLQRGWRRALILEGARRVGKTTILYQLADEFLRKRGFPPRRILYVSFDHPVLKLARLDQVMRLFAAVDKAEGEEALLLLDEIQYAADWSGWLKWLVDQHPRYRIVATGSASARLKAEGAEPAVGRWMAIPVPPLSFYEYVALRFSSVPDREIVSPSLPAPPAPDAGEKVTPVPPDFLWAANSGVSLSLEAVVERCLPVEEQFHRYLLLGGFPEVAILDHPQGLDLLRVDVVDRVLKRDMVALFNIRNILDLERLFIYLCLHTGEIINRETIARELGVTGPTVDNHLKAMEMAHLLLLLPNVDMGGKKLLRSRPKAYLADSSLRNAVLMQGEELLVDPVALGHLVETAVVIHVLAYARQFAPQAGYWRDAASGREVDLVLTFPRSAAVIEVKYQSGAKVRPGDGILAYRAGDPSVRRWLITRRAEEVGSDPETGVVRIPAFAFLYLLGWLAREPFAPGVGGTPPGGAERD